MSDTALQVREAMQRHPDFADIGKRMLLVWRESVAALSDRRIYALGSWKMSEALTGFVAPAKLDNPKIVIDRSELPVRPK